MEWKRILGVFLLASLLLGFLQFSSPNILGFDGFYHAKMAEVVSQDGIPNSFPWARETILADEFADLHLGYHLLLVPFTLPGLTLGAKVATVLFGGLCLTVFYWFLRRKEAAYPLFWTALYALASAWLLYRFLLPRQMPLLVAGILLSIILLEEKKHWWLFGLSFALALLHPGFVFQLFVVAVFIGFRWLCTKKLEYKAGLFSIFGAGFALIIHPHFPLNAALLWTQIFEVNLTGNVYNVEWKPWSLPAFLVNNAVVLALLGLSAFSLVRQRRVPRELLPYLFLTLFFLIYTALSRRMQEYLVPFAIIGAALACSQLMRKLMEGKRWKIPLGIMVVAILGLGTFQANAALQTIDANDFIANYQGCTDWLARNAPSGSVVFNHAYAFPYLFFKNDGLVYTHGLDLTYSQLKDEDKFARYMDVLQGRSLGGEDVIVEDYDPDYLVIGKLEQDVQIFEHVVAHRENYEAMYEDDWCAVLKTAGE